MKHALQEATSFGDTLNDRLRTWQRQFESSQSPQQVYSEAQERIKRQIEENLTIYNANPDPEIEQQIGSLHVTSDRLKRAYTEPTEGQTAEHERKLSSLHHEILADIVRLRGIEYFEQLLLELRDETSGPPSARTPQATPNSQDPNERTTEQTEAPPKKKIKTTVDLQAANTERRRTSQVKTSGQGDAPAFQRTVDFDEIYKNGTRKVPIQILSESGFPGVWYILRCDEHKLNFRTIRSAAGHYGSSHGFRYVAFAQVREKLGTLVTNCDAHKASKNNQAANASSDTYSPPRQNGPLPPPRESTRTHRIVKPDSGILHTTFWHASKKSYAVLQLPMSKPGEVEGLEGRTIWNTLLKQNPQPPACYLYDPVREDFYGWEPEFEDGGSKVHDRKVPVYFFDGFHSVAWIEAKALREYDPNDESLECRGVVERWMALHRNLPVNSKDTCSDNDTDIEHVDTPGSQSLSRSSYCVPPRATSPQAVQPELNHAMEISQAQKQKAPVARMHEVEQVESRNDSQESAIHPSGFVMHTPSQGVNHNSQEDDIFSRTPPASLQNSSIVPAAVQELASELSRGTEAPSCHPTSTPSAESTSERVNNAQKTGESFKVSSTASYSESFFQAVDHSQQLGSLATPKNKSGPDATAAFSSGNKKVRRTNQLPVSGLLHQRPKGYSTARAT